HCELSASIGRIFVNRVAVWIAEKEIASFAVPNRAFGEFEAFREFEDFWIRRHDRVERWIFANHLDIDLAWRDRDRHDTALVELELCLAHVDVVGGRIGQRTICAKNRELDLLAGLNAPIYDQPVRRVPTLHHRATTLTERA